MITNILEYLERSAIEYPDRIALADENKQISYFEYVKLAQKIGTFIAEKIKTTKAPIAVLIDKNIESIITFMGIVYSGNFYVPIDPSVPEKRIKLILDTLNPAMVISAVEGKTFEICDVIPHSQTLLAECDDVLLQDIRQNALDTDPLYSIFTSGSTGTPKGVLVCHRSIIDLVSQFSETFRFPEYPILGNQAPLDFDVSAKDIYCSLCMSGCVQMIPKKMFSVPGQLIPHIKERDINVIIWAVSAMRIVADFKILDTYVPEKLKLAMFSGEVMPIKSLNYWTEHLPDTTYVNLYGPTEITCNCTYHIVDRHYNIDEVLPIGKAFKNTDVFIYNENDNRVCAPNEIGEIVVRGTCLAHGYYNDPDRTSKAFVQNPLHSCYPETVYKTGDLGYRNKDGLLYFSSRKDFQIKHMGHRIELGEIEVAVNSLDFVDVGCCIYDNIKEKIYLCYQAPVQCDKEIIKALATILPKYMWPNKFKHFTQIPLNDHSKIDRVLLKEMCCNNVEV